MQSAQVYNLCMNSSGETHRESKLSGCFITPEPLKFKLTNSDLDVIPGGRVFQVVDGAQHVQGHVADMMRMKGGLVGYARHHHVGITDRLHLNRNEGGNFFYNNRLLFISIRKKAFL